MPTTRPAADLGSPTYLLECGECGIAFTVPAAFVALRKADHGTWYCPLGHARHWPAGKSETDRLREQLETERNSAAFWRAQEAEARRREAAAKGQVTKLKNRAKAGACPCCNRTFVQLARHMKTKHPDFAPAGA